MNTSFINKHPYAYFVIIGVQSSFIYFSWSSSESESSKLSRYGNLSFTFLAHLSYTQDELLWSLFVRRFVHLLTFSNDFSSEVPGQILLKFHMEPP